MTTLRKYFFCLSCIFLFIPYLGVAQEQVVNIYFGNSSHKDMQVSATLLADELNKVKYIKAVVKTGSPTNRETGIYLSLTKDADKLTYDPKLSSYNSEGLSVVSLPDKEQVYLVGNSILAVRHAVFFYLEALGYRYFFPNKRWHITPKKILPYQKLNIVTVPDYDHRRIWYAYGTDSNQADKDYDFWVKASRTEGAFQVNAGHEYQKIVKRNQKTFDLHPEYYALLPDGSRKPTSTPKFCYSNTGLVDLVVKDALRQFANAEAKGRELDMISMEPSDGGGHCTCDNCKALGSISDRVFHLTNQVAKVVGEKYPDKWVGMYAYNQHASPPSFELEPNIFVMVATAFNRSSFSTEQLVEKWGKKVSKVGIYDYYGVMSWDWDMPGQPRGSQIDYIQNGLEFYHANKATALSAETNIGWISRGLGHYVATKLLWDIDIDTKALSEEFFRLAYGKTEKPMKELYQLWEKNSNIPPTSFDIANWLSLLEEADQMVGDNETKMRIEHVKYYMHYVVLFHEWKNDPKNLEKYSSLLNYSWRIRGSGTVASYPLIRRIANSQAPSAKYKFDNKQAVWKNPTGPVKRDEINALIEEDAKKYKPVEGITSENYSANLSALSPSSPSPSARVKKNDGKVYEQNSTVNVHEIIFQVPEQQNGQMTFSIRSGFIKSNPPGGYVHISKYDGKTGEIGEVLLQENIPEDRTLLTITLNERLKPGTYHMRINDRKSGFKFQTSRNYPYALMANNQSKVSTWDRSNFYFYVPEGTEKFLVIREIVFTLKSPTGREISKDTEGKQTVEVGVKPGEAGVWQIVRQKGSFYFEGIPPFVSGSPQQLLIPTNVLPEGMSKN
ncbi:DUF4838 domain-containing protein [Catalinimonas sp. 4WD22]|uniref:DUF4838 domain-containing protein n=1 Tax=Catalinimonas locisalis TaxID=3133978 RepID=UPI003100B2B9